MHNVIFYAILTLMWIGMVINLIRIFVSPKIDDRIVGAISLLINIMTVGLLMGWV